jgi:pimeloyl-ACP methyl ester carboxylesterase
MTVRTMLREMARRIGRCGAAAVAYLGLGATVVGRPAGQGREWTDPSPHRVQRVAVDADVQLEVLDWGGSGPPLVLLAGAGNTAHVFDDLAPRLTTLGRVVGITRRGFGASTAAEAGYDAARLGADVWQVVTTLGLSRPVLVGHSIAGQELSWIATTQPGEVRGLVYIDAAYRYAFHRPGILENVQDLRARLGRLEGEIARPPRPPAELAAAIDAVMGDALTEVQQDLEDLRTTPPVPGAPPAPTAADLRTVASFRDWSRRVHGFAMPEAELRWLRAIGPDGVVGAARPLSPASKALASAGAQRFAAVRVPLLAIYASPHGLGPWATAPGIDRSRVEAFLRFDTRMTERQASWVERLMPDARVVRLPEASHYLFLSDADAVLRETTTFVKGLADR